MGFNSGPPMVPGPYSRMVSRSGGRPSSGTTRASCTMFGVPGLIDRNLRLVERFTRIESDVLMYRFTVTDPTVWTRPWSAEVPMTRINAVAMEYGCHEGNYGLANILAGARAEER